MISDKTANIVIGVVTVIWAASILAGIFNLNDYNPSESVNGIFLAVVGAALAARHKSGGGDPK